MFFTCRCFFKHIYVCIYERGAKTFFSVIVLRFKLLGERVEKLERSVCFPSKSSTAHRE